MTATSKIRIDVDASKFEALQKAFARYKEELDKTPDAWRSVSLAQEVVREGFQQAAEEAFRVSEETTRFLENSKRLDYVTETTSRHWKDMVRSTASVASHIASATASLLKWAGITSIIGGIASGGTLFGLDRLGEGVSSQRTQALGLGTTYGGLSAFRTQFRRLGDPEGFLSRISTALSDPEQLGIFQQLGVSTQGDTTDVATRSILRLKDTIDRIPKNQLALGLETRRLDKLVDIETAKVLQGMSREEVAKLAGGVGPLRNKLDLTPADQLKWQEFTTQLERSSRIIGTAFTNRLVALADPLKHLTKSFTSLLDTLMRKGGPVEHWINEVATGMEWLAKNIDSPEVQKSIKYWRDELVHIGESAWSLGKAVAGLADKFSSLFGISPAEASTGPHGEGAGGVGSAGRGRGSIRYHAGDSDYIPSKEFYGEGSSAGNLTKLIEEESRKAGVDPRILEGIRAGESFHRQDWYDKKDDAIESSWGPFQLNRRRGLGVEFERDTGLDLRDPRSIPAQVRWVANYVKQGRSLRPWAGYHGPREADPRWGDSGYKPQPMRTGAPEKPASVSKFDFAKRSKITISNNSGANINTLSLAASAH